MFYEIEEGLYKEVVPYMEKDDEVTRARQELRLSLPLSVWGFTDIKIGDLFVLVYQEIQYVVQLYPARIYGKVDVENPFM